MTIYEQDLTEVLQFFGAWFNQDFDSEFSTYDEAVNVYTTSTPAAILDKTLAQLNLLINSELDDNDLAEFAFNDLYLDMDFRQDGLTFRDWLKDLIELINKNKK